MSQTTFIIYDTLLLIGLWAVGFIWLKALLTFLNALASMISFYTVDPHTEENVRSAQQSDYLSNYLRYRDRAINIILFSTLGFGAIIIARYLLEALHANL